MLKIILTVITGLLLITSIILFIIYLVDYVAFHHTDDMLWSRFHKCADDFVYVKTYIFDKSMNKSGDVYELRDKFGRLHFSACVWLNTGLCSIHYANTNCLLSTFDADNSRIMAKLLSKHKTEERIVNVDE